MDDYPEFSGRFIRELGMGANADISLYETSDGRLVALKLLPLFYSTGQEERFFSELRALEEMNRIAIAGVCRARLLKFQGRPAIEMEALVEEAGWYRIDKASLTDQEKQKVFSKLMRVLEKIPAHHRTCWEPKASGLFVQRESLDIRLIDFGQSSAPFFYKWLEQIERLCYEFLGVEKLPETIKLRAKD